AGHAFWDIVDTLVTGIAFGLVGLELHNAVDTAAGHWGEPLGWAGAVVGVVVLVRLAWLLPATWLTKRLHAARDTGEEIPLGWRETVVMWWSGMRGVASRSEEHTSELQSRENLVCRLLLEKKKKNKSQNI